MKHETPLFAYARLSKLCVARINSVLPELEVGKCHISEFNHTLHFYTLGFFVAKFAQEVFRVVNRTCISH